jgi:hypothetical protein
LNIKNDLAQRLTSAMTFGEINHLRMNYDDVLADLATPDTKRISNFTSDGKSV